MNKINSTSRHVTSYVISRHVICHVMSCHVMSAGIERDLPRAFDNFRQAARLGHASEKGREEKGREEKGREDLGA